VYKINSIFCILLFTDDFRIVYSLDTIRARKKLGYEIGKLKINGINIVEYYANTDPYLALVMGVSALPGTYTVVKFAMFALTLINIKYSSKNI